MDLVGARNSAHNDIIPQSHYQLALRSQKTEISPIAVWEISAGYKKGSGTSQIEILESNRSGVRNKE